MADVKKARIFLRRGDDASRLGTTLCEAELGYSTDGKRVFVGDDSTVGGNAVGNKVWVLSAGSDITTLTAASGDGRAELGDLAWIPSAAYNVTTVNASAPSATITPATDTGLLYALSARAGSGDLTWVLANSGIPLSQIDIPDNGISGDKIHGGDISGSINFSGSIGVATSLQTSTGKVHALSGTGSRAVFATADGTLSTGSNNVITSTQYFDKQNLTTTLSYVDNTGNTPPAPLAGDGNWTVIDMSAAITTSGITMPVSFPKVAIINVYNQNTRALGDRQLFALFTSHATSSYDTSANHNLMARWGVGEDAGGGKDFFAFGGTYFVRLNGTTNNLIVQYTRTHDAGGDPEDSDLAIDLIGVQY